MGTVDNSCALPALLVATSTLTGSSGTGGEVMRWSLASGTPTPCSTLKGQGLLGGQLWGVGFLAPNYVAASTPSQLFLVDASKDIITWQKAAPSGNFWSPLATFSVQDGATTGIAFGFGEVTNPTDYSIGEIDAYHADGSMVANTPWCPSSTTNCHPLGVTTQTPAFFGNLKTPGHLWSVDNSNNTALWDIDPSVPTKTAYIAGNNDFLITVYAVKVGSTIRIAWLNASASQPTSVDWVNDSGGATPTLAGPLRCATGCTNIVDVVPDPTSQDGFLMLCDGASQSKRTLTRLKTDGTCSQFFDGSTLGDAFGLQKLSIAQ
jgi:hypothetical protein